MLRRDVTFTEKIKNQLAEKTGVLILQLHTLYSSKRNYEMNGHYTLDKRDLPKNEV
jgi:hypothetical protein